jgi:polysaccharide biosynthesis protein PslG
MQPAPRLTATVRLLVPALCLLLAATMLPAVGAQAAAKPKGIAVSKYFFGMHDSQPTSWPKAKIGALRLWDAGVSWRDIETSPGTYDFARLNLLVDTARLHGAEVTLVLGQTPAFRTQVPATRVGYFGVGAPEMPDVAAWRAYVRAVANAFAGRISNLQVWNEANVVGFWSGSVSQMAELTFWARTELNEVNRTHGTTMKLLSPAWVVRSNPAPFNAYWKTATWGGFRMRSLVDVVSLSLYPSAAGQPEDAIARLASARRTLTAAKVTKPVWNTEVNYGLSAGGLGARPKAISSARQAAYVVRTYLLNASNGVDRVFWYAWDLKTIANTTLSTSAGPTLAGRAVNLTRSWLTGARLLGCSRASKGSLRGTYTCTLTYRGGVRRVYWNPTRRVTITTARTATFRTTLYGRSSRLKGGSKLKVDYQPVLVRSSK